MARVTTTDGARRPPLPTVPHPPPYPDPQMPTRASHEAARLLRLVALLEAGPRNAADLARQLGVSQRTLQRDLEELPELGHDVERDGRRYRLRAGVTSLDPVEALAVHTATRRSPITTVGSCWTSAPRGWASAHSTTRRPAP